MQQHEQDRTIARQSSSGNCRFVNCEPRTPDSTQNSRSDAENQKDRNTLIYGRNESGSGRFYRRFILPETVDAEKVEAKERHGVLEISIPKQAKAMPRRIEVAA